MKKFTSLVLMTLAASAALTGLPALADNMVSLSIFPSTGAVTLSPRWSIGSDLAGFHQMAQDLNLGGEANDFYSLKASTIAAGGDITAFTFYVAASGAATNHVDIGSKLRPDAYSALTSADPDVGFGPVNMYFIHHKATGDYFTVLVPSSGVASSVTDLKPMNGPGGPATLGTSGYLGLTFAASNLGYGLNYFYYLRTDAVTGFTKFGTMDPALAGASADAFDLGIGGFKALVFSGNDVGFGTSQMYYLRLDPVTGFTIFGKLDPAVAGIRHTSDIANLGSVFTTLTFVPNDVGFGSNQFYATGVVNVTWQSVSFAAIADRPISAGSFTVTPSASSTLPITLTVVPGSTGAALISAPVAGVFTVTPTAPGLITLQASQAGQVLPVAYEANMLRQSFTVVGVAINTVVSDFDGDGTSEPLWRNSNTNEIATWTMAAGSLGFGMESGGWVVINTGDFDGDGRADLVWRNSNTNEIATWTAAGSSLGLGTEGGGWVVINVGDFDGDGRSEILWRNTITNEIATWTMAGNPLNLGLEGGGWVVIDVGDFDGDGRAEPLWRNTITNEIATWTMAGGSLSFGTESGGWVVIDVGDFDGDHRAEPLWRNSNTTAIASWTMAGSWFSFGTESGGWQVINVGDYDGDGRSELLWHNTTTTEDSTWTMARGYHSFGLEDNGWHVIQF